MVELQDSVERQLLEQERVEQLEVQEQLQMGLDEHLERGQVAMQDQEQLEHS
jgi:hypothetical protein